MFWTGIGMWLRQPEPQVPYAQLLAQCVRQRFDPIECERRLAESVHKLELDEFLDPTSIRNGGFIATRRLLFDAFARNRPWYWSARRRNAPASFSLKLNENEIGTVAELISLGATCRDAKTFRRIAEPLIDNELLHLLCEAPDRRSFGTWSRIHEPGIYRREHACLALHSGRTTLVVDPQALNAGYTTNDLRYPEDGMIGHTDGILLTHVHSDHWHSPSMFYYATSENCRIIVPCVPKPSLLSPEDPASILRLARRKVETPDWFSTVSIGDFEVDILPFYGEQPTTTLAPYESKFRNWGNCYRINCSDFSVLLLADSGSDHAGNMQDVIAKSVDRRGPVDAVLSVAANFPEVINRGLPHYFLAVRFSVAAAAFSSSNQKSMTLGPAGLAAVCSIANARFLLPYALGFRGIGKDPTSNEAAGCSESQLIAQLEAEFQARNVRTSVLSWRPGDVAVFRDRKLTLRQSH